MAKIILSLLLVAAALAAYRRFAPAARARAEAVARAARKATEHQARDDGRTIDLKRSPDGSYRPEADTK